MTHYSFAKALKQYSPITVFVPFTLMYFLIVVFSVGILLLQRPLVTYENYGYYLIGASGVSLLTGYLLTYASIIKFFDRDKNYLFGLALVSYIAQIWFTLQSIFVLTKENYPLFAFQPFIISSLLLFAQAVLSRFSNISRNSVWMIGFNIFLFLALNVFYVPSDSIYRVQVQSFLTSARFLNFGFLLLLVVQGLFFLVVSNYVYSKFKQKV